MRDEKYWAELEKRSKRDARNGKVAFALLVSFMMLATVFVAVYR